MLQTPPNCSNETADVESQDPVPREMIPAGRATWAFMQRMCRPVRKKGEMSIRCGVAMRLWPVLLFFLVWGGAHAPLRAAFHLYEEGAYPIGALGPVASQGEMLYYASDATLIIGRQESNQGVTILARLPLFTTISRLLPHGDTLYVGLLRGEIVAVSVEIPELPRVIWRDDRSHDPLYDLAVGENTLYALFYRYGLAVYDISRPEHPERLTWIPLPDSAYQLAVEGDLGVVASVHDTLWILDLSNPAQPSLAGAFGGEEQDRYYNRVVR